ncbi:lectin-like [Magallana gigas]|uniref:lectin-like n=1 Tax=Magallana gigas TaxID=29159 RepID=UPI00333EB2E1
MSRNPTYDNRATLSTNVISTLIFRSSIHCASYCTRNDECKSTMYNMNTHSCQLLSVHMDAVSDTGPQTYHGWLYYERKIDGTMPTTTTVDVETTVVSTETTQTTFDCSIWHYRFGHWYLLDSNYRTFNDSRTFCASLSPPAYVIEVQSQADNDWLSELTSTLCEAPGEYWLNGYDTDNSGTFTWIDSQTPSTYTNWYQPTGEPNDSTGPGSEKCIASSTGYMGVWVDIPCTVTRPVVCERNF